MKRNDNFTNENDINDHNNPIKGYEFSIMNIRANSKPEMKRAFDLIGRIFLDTEENNYYKICNVIKISGDSSVHGVRFFRFYSIANPLISMILNTKISIKLLTTMKHIILILSILSQ
jgi:hypothetical protein